MRLQLRDLRWHEEIIAMARREGWTVFEQGTQRRRPEDPTFFATHGTTVIAVWLRSAAARPSRVPPIDRYAEAGVLGFYWSPLDAAKARAVLVSVHRVRREPVEGPGPGDGAA